MTGKFPRIGLFCKSTGEKVSETLNHLVAYLGKRQHQLVIEQSSADLLPKDQIKTYPSDQIGQHCDLVIVVGGDGSLLKAARAIADNNIPIIGINRGALGFLADINPQTLEQTLTPILDGDYHAEERTMLKASIIQNQKPISQHLALNDVVLHHGDIARLIEFEIYVDDQFVVDHRSDGLITATPTGSTAYALSGGGPIIYPTLDVITLVPMFPHTLSARPIVIHKNSKIRLVITASNRIDARLSCDGQTHLSLSPNDEVHIQAHSKSLHLLHPKDYNYYSMLRERLGWNTNLTK